MNPKPVIGLSTYAEPARWAAWHAPAALLPLNYAEQVAAELADGEHHPFVLAVQWHPEACDDLPLLAALVAAAQGVPWQG